VTHGHANRPSTFRFPSADGTSITGWRNGEHGVPVVISNGLGTPPAAWPCLVRPGAGLRAVTYYYRGTGESARPRDRSRIRVEDHLADLVALMDHERIDRAVVASWSVGVNVAFELARRHPDRVAGMLVVAGVPGGTFRSMFAPVGVPRRHREALAHRVVRTARAIGPVLSAIARRVPLNELSASVIAHTGFVLPYAKPRDLVPALREFLQHDFRWYFDLALAAAEHAPMDVSFLRCPTTVVAGRWDALTAHDDVAAFARDIPGARFVELPGSHFLPVEFPDRLHELLHEVVARSGLGAAHAVTSSADR
jgi:pimeloyl-ACP methyl ester carboxylesterase